MRVSKQAAAEDRRRIPDTAARLLREEGIGGTGVDTVTTQARTSY